MIIDADTHNFCLELFEDFEDKEFYHTIKNLLIPGFDPDQKWQMLYNRVKDPAWPAAGTCADFHLLPEFIRQELKTHHQFELAHISDDLQSVYLDDKNSYAPTIDQQLINGSLFCKTTHQLINLETISYLFDFYKDSATAVKLMQHYNKKMCELCEQNSNLDFNLWLVLDNIDACMDELRKYKDRKFFGVLIDDRLPWAIIDTVSPIFEFCNQHKIPVCMHILVSKLPIDGITWDSNHKNYKTLIREYPFCHVAPPKFQEWKTNVALLITENVFDRWPDLRIVIAEKHQDWISPLREFMIKQNLPDPLPYFKKHFWFTTEPEEQEFFKKAELLGWDRLLFSTDYPHNDPGGMNRYADVNLVKKYLDNGVITETQYNQLTYKNYLFLKNRI